MKMWFRHFMISASCALMLSASSYGIVYADVYSDAGAAIGQAIANNMSFDPAKTVSTEEYVNEDYDASHLKKIFLVCEIPQGFEQFIDSPFAIGSTLQVVNKNLTSRGFEVSDMNEVITKVSQKENVNLAEMFKQDSAQATALLSAYAKENFDAVGMIHLYTYRMIPGQRSNRAEATMEVTFNDAKTETPIYSYRRQYIRANLPLAPNSPESMVKKISNIFAKNLASKVSHDAKKAGK